jgi:uncharacterized membrane protein (DUF4010 family)
LRLREALAVAALLAAVSALVAWAQRTLGVNGLLASTALAALADAHAPVAALATQQAAGSVSAALLLHGALLAVAGNALTRAGAAWVAGGRAYGLAVSATLALSVAAAGGMVVLAGP